MNAFSIHSGQRSAATLPAQRSGRRATPVLRSAAPATGAATQQQEAAAAAAPRSGLKHLSEDAKKRALAAT